MCAFMRNGPAHRHYSSLQRIIVDMYMQSKQHAKRYRMNVPTCGQKIDFLWPLLQASYRCKLAEDLHLSEVLVTGTTVLESLRNYAHALQASLLLTLGYIIKSS